MTRKPMFARYLLSIAVLMIGFSFFLSERLPSPDGLNTSLVTDPVQVPTDRDSFTVESEGVEYTINPLYDYDIRGLVVSEHRTDVWWGYYHKRWQDYLNVKDLCMVWGENALTGLYHDFLFRNGSYTCYYRTRSNAAYRAWNHDELSNNHLLTESRAVARTLRSVRPGDQVEIKGYLATYSHDGGFNRGTSITRDDTGNEACETIYVTEVEILERGNQVWRMVGMVGWILIGGFVLYSIIRLVSNAKRITEKQQGRKMKKQVQLKTDTSNLFPDYKDMKDEKTRSK